MSVLHARYSNLIDKRFLAGLTDAEVTELRQIEAAFDEQDALFYKAYEKHLRDELNRLKKDDPFCSVCGEKYIADFCGKGLCSEPLPDEDVRGGYSVKHFKNSTD